MVSMNCEPSPLPVKFEDKKKGCSVPPFSGVKEKSAKYNCVPFLKGGAAGEGCGVPLGVVDELLRDCAKSRVAKEESVMMVVVVCMFSERRLLFSVFLYEVINTLLLLH